LVIRQNARRQCGPNFPDIGEIGLHAVFFFLVDLAALDGLQNLKGAIFYEN